MILEACWRGGYSGLFVTCVPAFGNGSAVQLQSEFVAAELKKLVGWGAHPKRLALHPELRRLAGVTADTSLVEAGYLIRRYLVEAISALSGSYEFQGRRIEAEQLKRVYRVLLQIEGSGQSAVNRRYRAITVLEVYCSVEQWRRPFGPERELLAILAESMTKPEPRRQT